MKIEFSKYQGAGNDFIIIDCRAKDINLSEPQITLLCDRRFGIGADGLMSIHNSSETDFEMKYYNSDGKEASMCGNGGRCIALFAYKNRISDKKMRFNAIDGVHHAEIKDKLISLSMSDVKEITEFRDGYFLNTGSPHFVKFVEDIESINVFTTGKSIADEARFAPERTNVNFVEQTGMQTKIATFERGVENETLACGTGAVASAIALHYAGLQNVLPVKIKAKGGILEVNFEYKNNLFEKVFLTGPAEFVFKGEIEI